MNLNDFESLLAGHLKKLAGVHAVGDKWVGFDPKEKPAGVQLFSGQEVSRAAYSKHWGLVNSGKRTLVTEAEWQAYVAEHGFCPWFSEGDGSTTYRFPLVQGVHPKFVAALAEAGQYLEAGAPNIAGKLGRLPRNLGAQQGYPQSEGALYYETSGISEIHNANSDSKSQSGFIVLNASLSSSVYRDDIDTVQPPALTFLLGEYVVSSVAVVGEADAESLLASVTQLEAAIKYTVSSINGTMLFTLDNGSTVELRRAGDAGAYTLSVVYIAKDGTKKFGVLMNSEGEFLPGAFYAPNLSAGVSISASTTYTVPSNGFLIVHVCSSNSARMDVTINGATISFSQDDTGHNQTCIPVKKGDTVYWKIASGNMNWSKTVHFYPAR